MIDHIEIFNSINQDLRELDERQIRQLNTNFCKGKLKFFDQFTHKGQRGHAAIFAGSQGMMGAALLTIKATLKSGAGKITAIIPESYVDLVHFSSPEALVQTDLDKIDFNQFDALAMGPGLGQKTLSISLVEKIFSSKIKMVLDADLLNFLSKNPTLIDQIPEQSILTPHPLEWKRLFGDSENDKKRILDTMQICSKYGFYVIIKGHISTLVTPDGRIYFNAMGNAGMAKGGSGDVLTGLLVGLFAQGYSTQETGILGMYVHGMAGDLAKDLYGENAMTPSDQICQLASAFLTLK